MNASTHKKIQNSFKLKVSTCTVTRILNLTTLFALQLKQSGQVCFSWICRSHKLSTLTINRFTSFCVVAPNDHPAWESISKLDANSPSSDANTNGDDDGSRQKANAILIYHLCSFPKWCWNALSGRSPTFIVSWTIDCLINKWLTCSAFKMPIFH